MLKIFAIFIACAALCVAQLPEGLDWHHGAFVTNVDHFRPLDVRQVHLVSAMQFKTKILFKYVYLDYK